MRRLRYLIPARRASRAAISLALALSAMGWLITAGATPAQACSLSSHCYAASYADDTTTNYGMIGTVYAACLHNTDDGNFVDNEVWDVSTSTNPASYWEEVGLTSGAAYNGNYYSDKTWFFAADTPGGGYTENEPNIDPAATNVGYTIEIIYDGGQQWSIYGGNSFFQLGTTTDQSATLNDGEAGTEYTSYRGADLRDGGEVSSLKRISTAFNVYPWGNAGTIGPTGYISGSYYNAAESWAWACP